MKHVLFTILLFINTVVLLGQYNYGLEVENHDAKIEGKLNLNDGGNSVFIGLDAGLNDDASSNGIVAVGKEAGKANLSGINSVYLGTYAGRSNTSSNSTFVGALAGLNTNAGGNTFLGTAAGINTSGADNTILGFFAGENTNSAWHSVFVGVEAGRLNTTGYQNVYVGRRAGKQNLTSNGNTLIGFDAGWQNTGKDNTMLGAEVGASLTTGENNVFIGRRAGSNSNSSGSIFLGNQAGSNESNPNRLYIDNSNTPNPLIWGDFTDGNEEVKINGTATIQGNTEIRGYLDLGSNDDAISQNLVIGTSAGANLPDPSMTGFGVVGRKNTFIGYEAGMNNSNNLSVMVGYAAGKSNTGQRNTFLGQEAGWNSTSGEDNTFIGNWAGRESGTGNANVYLGKDAGANATGGSNNIFIGYKAGMNASVSDQLFVHNNASNTPLIWGDFTDGNEEVKINGITTLNDVLNLKPLPTPTIGGACTRNGQILYSDDHNLFLCKNSIWVIIDTSP